MFACSTGSSFPFPETEFYIYAHTREIHVQQWQNAWCGTMIVRIFFTEARKNVNQWFIWCDTWTLRNWTNKWNRNNNHHSNGWAGERVWRCKRTKPNECDIHREMCGKFCVRGRNRRTRVIEGRINIDPLKWIMRNSILSTIYNSILHFMAHTRNGKWEKGIYSCLH